MVADGRIMRRGWCKSCVVEGETVADRARMPRIAWFTISYAVAVVLAVSMRSAGYDEFASLPAALVVWIILPFVISKACALFIRSITQTPKQHDERCTGHDQQSGD